MLKRCAVKFHLPNIDPKTSCESSLSLIRTSTNGYNSLLFSLATLLLHCRSLHSQISTSQIAVPSFWLRWPRSPLVVNPTTMMLMTRIHSSAPFWTFRMCTLPLTAERNPGLLPFHSLPPLTKRRLVRKARTWGSHPHHRIIVFRFTNFWIWFRSIGSRSIRGISRKTS